MVGFDSGQSLDMPKVLNLIDPLNQRLGTPPQVIKPCAALEEHQNRVMAFALHWS